MATRKKTPKSANTKLQNRYFDRDESWLAFNGRVLEEAQDKGNPLLERVKFLAITASNLDEFYEIRLAAILQRLEEGHDERGADGRTLAETLDHLRGHVHNFVTAQYACWNDLLLPELGRHGIHVLAWTELDNEQRNHASHYYQTEVDPLLTPVTIDPAHPFPRVLNKALCVALLLRRKRKGTPGPVLGVVTVPRSLPRLVKLPSDEGTTNYIFLHDLIENHAKTLYRGYEILSTTAFRVTRNSNLYLQEEESRNLLESVRAELHNRRKGDAVRLEIDSDAHPEIVEQLRMNYELDEWQVFRTDGPVNLNRLMNLYSETPRPDLKYRPFTGRELRLHRTSTDMFEELRRGDVLLHHPYDSYDPVVAFIESAARDPRIVSIKQTLYRTSADSPIFQALIEAAQSTEVTVVVELMARFDEASNIRWARNMEDAGVQVFHGIVGLKTHCKLALIVRRDPDGVTRRYVHLGTGNYNPVTSRFYTDLSLLTADHEITAAVHSVFNYLTAHAERDDYKPLQVSPLTLAQSQIRLIHREADHARAGRPARIIAKMNSLLEPSIIEALYDASNAGVEIDLIVRGICALRPGVRGMSDRIHVRSIVGRFLEHSRIYCFANGGNEEIYSGSADWMPRNLFERCEVIFPIKDPQLRQRVRGEILAAYLVDNVKARLLRADGSYVRATAGKNPTFSAQEFFMHVAEGKDSVANIPMTAAEAAHLRKEILPVPHAVAAPKQVLAIAAHEAKENGSASNSPKNGSASANGGARPAADARVKTQVPAAE
jgi:polyphosphate kinase